MIHGPTSLFADKYSIMYYVLKGAKGDLLDWSYDHQDFGILVENVVNWFAPRKIEI